MFCRMCGEQIPNDCEVCPICGEEQVITITTEETGESGNEDAGGTVVTVLKEAEKVIGTVVGTTINTIIVPTVSEEVGKELQKKAKKGTSDFLKAMGLKKETPLDKVSKALKTMRKRTRK